MVAEEGECHPTPHNPLNFRTGKSASAHFAADVLSMESDWGRTGWLPHATGTFEQIAQYGALIGGGTYGREDDGFRFVADRLEGDIRRSDRCAFLDGKRDAMAGRDHRQQRAARSQPRTEDAWTPVRTLMQPVNRETCSTNEQSRHRHQGTHGFPLSTGSPRNLPFRFRLQDGS